MFIDMYHKAVPSEVELDSGTLSRSHVYMWAVYTQTHTKTVQDLRSCCLSRLGHKPEQASLRTSQILA